MQKTILITGGYGYVGSQITKELLEKGYTVRLAVRNKSRISAYEHILKLAEESSGKLEIWEADLTRKGSFDEAAKGADAIIHTASPFTLRFKDAQKELIDPALDGTRNVLSAASKSGTVKKVVLTSSIVAVFGDNIDMRTRGLNALNEAHFNETSTAEHQPYAYSKTLAEKEAWEIESMQNDWKLVVINPGFVMGPSLGGASNSESLMFMKNYLTGKYLTGVPNLVFGFVDVHDVAHAHLLALENTRTDGRFIVSATTMDMFDFSKIIKKYCSKKYLLPMMQGPKIVIFLIGWMFGLSLKYISRNVGYPLKFDNHKSRETLGLEYRNMDETVKDMVEWLESRSK